NKVVIFPKGDLKKGDYIRVHIDRCTSGTLFGKIVSL
ncbi:MAG: TRAM domain-containing protein, partial [Chitinophagaceae bacterium]